MALHIAKNFSIKCLNSNVLETNILTYFKSCTSYLSSASHSEETENARPISEMPGMKSYPLVGNFLSVLTHKDFDSKKMHIFWQHMMKEYGPICRMTMPGLPSLVAVSNPDYIEKVFRITMNNPIRNGFFALKKIREDAVDNYFEKKTGLLTENNEEWWRVRSRVQTPMMKPKNIVRYLPEMDKVTLAFIERIAKFQEQNGEMPSNFQDELYKWALESIGTVALNRRLGCLDPNLSSDSTQMNLINSVNKLFHYLNEIEMDVPWWRILPSPGLKKLKESHEEVLMIVDAHIEEAESELKNKMSKTQDNDQDLTLLEILLQTEGLSRKDVVTFMIDMFFAGIDSTSHTLAFILYLLAKNKKAQKRLQEEIDTVIGDGKGPITESHLARLSYLKLCIKESMRVFPPAIGSARALTEDAVIGGYLIPKGYQVLTVNIAIVKDESYFPRANEYLPERWGRDKPLGPIHPYASLPFAHGTRMCIGRRIAEQEMYTFLARIMHRFNVDYKYKDIDMVSRIISVPTEPLRFEFTERK